MNFLKIGLILSFSALFVFACTQANNSSVANESNNSVSAVTTPAETRVPTDGDELAAARKIYSEACVNCHKADGTGGITTVEGKNIKAPNFTSARQKAEPDAEYVEVIEHGEKEDGMPAYKDKISEADIKNLVKYIRKEFQGK